MLNHLHTRAERLAVAKVQGIAERYACRTPVDVDAAVAEIHAITADAHLLGHAWPAEVAHPLSPFPDPWCERKREILRRAGADPQPRSWEVDPHRR